MTEEEVLGAVKELVAAGEYLDEIPGVPGARLSGGGVFQDAESVTAVDASPEMIEIASARVGGDARVRFVQADLFRRRPERRYDVVFFGFWLSHVPPERFESFWSLVAECLAPGGRVLFADDAYRTSDELIEGEASATIHRGRSPRFAASACRHITTCAATT